MAKVLASRCTGMPAARCPRSSTTMPPTVGLTCKAFKSRAAGAGLIFARSLSAALPAARELAALPGASSLMASTLGFSSTISASARPLASSFIMPSSSNPSALRVAGSGPSLALRFEGNALSAFSMLTSATSGVEGVGWDSASAFDSTLGTSTTRSAFGAGSNSHFQPKVRSNNTAAAAARRGNQNKIGPVLL